MAAGLEGYLWFTATPYLLAAAALFLWWRGPGWRAIGLRSPRTPAKPKLDAEDVTSEGWPAKPTLGAAQVTSGGWRRTLLVACVLSGYQFASLYVVEPLVARLTTGELPDVSLFASLVGDERQLLFWLAMSWTLAAFMEEMVYRGWITARIAELGGLSSTAWVIAILASSVLFGLGHLYQGTSGVITTGLAGLIFGAAYLASGRNLWCAILAHGLTDTIGFVMIYLGVYPGL